MMFGKKMKMHAVAAGSGNPISFDSCCYGSERIRWVSYETNLSGKPKRVREPVETTREYPALGVFKAAGKTYTNKKQLSMKRNGDFCTDMYGRQWLHLRERFPIFDSFDAIYEDRYFHWFFLRENDRLTRVYYADERESLFVTEDVQEIEYKCFRELQKLGFLE